MELEEVQEVEVVEEVGNSSSTSRKSFDIDQNNRVTNRMRQVTNKQQTYQSQHQHGPPYKMKKNN
jgi:hypothetical protein